MKLLTLYLIIFFVLAPVAHADLDLDGVDDFASTTVDLINFMTLTTGTLMVWYLPTTPNPSTTCASVTVFAQMIFGDAENFIGILRPTATTTCVRGWDEVADVPRIVTATSGSVWAHLTLKLTGGNISMYLNGVSQGSLAIASFINLNTLVRLGLGGAFVAGAGRVADARIYSTGLSDGEIAAIAGGKRTRLLGARPTGQWVLDQCTPGASADLVAFRNLGSITSTPSMTADNGANNTGLTCQASTVLSQWGGVQ